MMTLTYLLISAYVGCPASEWRVSQVTDFSYVFSGAGSEDESFQTDISSWDLSNAKTMKGE